MVNVMKANISGKPAQRLRQYQVRASRQGRQFGGPLGGRSPIRGLELVLDVKQPDADRGRNDRHWHMHSEKWSNSQRSRKASEDANYGGIGSHGADPCRRF